MHIWGEGLTNPKIVLTNFLEFQICANQSFGSGQSMITTSPDGSCGLLSGGAAASYLVRCDNKANSLAAVLSEFGNIEE